MSKKFEPRNTEFFECDCHDRDHLIRAEYSTWISDYLKSGEKIFERDLNIAFEVQLTDYDNIYIKDNKIVQFKDRCIWRIKHAFKILIHGEITTQGYFSPCRSLINTKGPNVEQLFGYETTKNFAEWLSVKADEIKADYDKDIGEYNKKKEEDLRKK
jgi:hypothetical protein